MWAADVFAQTACDPRVAALPLHCRELFVDGYDALGNRIYDKVEGQTCHQCRQKTMGKRTSCSKCQSLSVRSS